MSTILVVDDSPTALKLVSKALATAGHHIIMASNGEEAVAKATDAHPDLIVLDVIMPHKWLPGLSPIEKRREDTRYQDHPCTRQNQQADLFWGMQQGADAYLAKPFDEAELLATAASFHDQALSCQHKE